ncbi:hypothetical protein CsSME_00000336 [Camellia sinensis var. sinensis]
MAQNFPRLIPFLLLAFALTALKTTLAGDPDILSDFIVPQNVSHVDASMAEFPALNGQSVSYAVLFYPAGSINPPHTHPRAAELLFLVDGTLEVGFVDTKNYNRNHNKSALAISAFGSASAGIVSVPVSVFGTDIDDEILAKAFKTDIDTVKKIKARFPKP